MVRVLFDTSVLVPALVVSHPEHSICFPRLLAAESKQIEALISTHSLAETYSVITRLPIQPRITPEQAQTVIIDISQQCEVIPLLPNDYLAAIAQMVALKLPGGGIFDALIAQAALKANADILLTLNPRHFTRLGEAMSDDKPLRVYANLVQVPE